MENPFTPHEQAKCMFFGAVKEYVTSFGIKMAGGTGCYRDVQDGKAISIEFEYKGKQFKYVYVLPVDAKLYDDDVRYSTALNIQEKVNE